jgi:hypothetical protein
MLKNIWIKRIGSALIIMLGGFFLLNLAFGIFGGIAALITLIGKVPEGPNVWIAQFASAIGFVVIALLTWLIFKSKLPVLLKATYLVVPMAAVLVACGAGLYRWPILSYGLGTVLVLALLIVFYIKKQPWQYWFAAIAMALTLAIFTLLGGEI